jgi:excisionase family DNA binding protein
VKEVEMEKLLLKVPEAAAVVGLGQSKFYELIRRGEIPAVRIGRATRVPVEGLRSWVEAQTEGVGGEHSMPAPCGMAPRKETSRERLLNRYVSVRRAGAESRLRDEVDDYPR